MNGVALSAGELIYSVFLFVLFQPETKCLILQNVSTLEQFSQLNAESLDQIGISDPDQKSRLLTASLLVSSLVGMIVNGDSSRTDPLRRSSSGQKNGRKRPSSTDFLNSLTENEQLDVCIPSPTDRPTYGGLLADQMPLKGPDSHAPSPSTDANGEDFQDALSDVGSDAMRDSGCYINGRECEEAAA